VMLLQTIFGASLILFCILGSSLPKTFRIAGAIVGTVSLSFLSMPMIPV
jgi:hypothetical protein